jgi:toxin ParE1/3/4
VTYTVRLEERANAWMQREVAYLADRRPEAAANFITAIERAREQLSAHPLSGRPGTIPDTRLLVVGDYILSYRVRRDIVGIFAIRHARQRDARAPVSDI